MEANRDAAVACRERARSFFREGRISEAERLARKAERLDPSIKVADILINVGSESVGRRSPGRRNDATPPSSAPDTRAKSEERGFTKSQVESVRRIMVCKDLYELLGIDKNATDDDIKRAYKSLARKFHPDKNKAPGATEAFKKIGNAFNVLLDPVKRRRYDQFGTVDDARPSVTRHRHHDGGVYTFDGNGAFDPDFINMFFNGGSPFFQNVHYARQARPRRTHESEQENNYFTYVQILPLLILFAMSFFSSLFVKDPVFSLQRTAKYSVERTTETHNLPYYVKESFNQDYDGTVRQLETQVLEQHVYVLRDRCLKERGYREAMLYRARSLRDENAFEHAKRLTTPSCDRVVQLYS